MTLRHLQRCICETDNPETSPCFYWSNAPDADKTLNPRACICSDLASGGVLPS